jgi:hypothetical protein
MRVFSGSVAKVLFVLALCSGSGVLAQAPDLRFRGPFTITNVPRPVVTVHEGDIDGDGKIDLISSNGTGTVLVLFQDKENRRSWTPVPVRVGSACFFTRGGDFDGDGFDDLAVADGSSTTYVIRSRGDRTFEAPIPIRDSRGSRWIATGDWNKDGKLDFASSNLNTSTLTIFLGDGAFKFTLTQQPPSGREHTLEALDYDGDGILDLALGQGIPGIQLHRGLGDGKFQLRGTVPGHGGLLGCVEYIAVGDFNKDGKGDLAPTCIDDGTAYAGTSVGNGTYVRILREPFASGTESTAVGDLDGDGNDDLALVSHGSTLLRVYLGKGDGKFETPLDFGNTGTKPVFLIAPDLDRDGFLDVVSADEGSGTLTIFFGKGGEQFLESTQSVAGYGTAKDYAIADWDRDGLPDFFFASSTTPAIHVYLKPGLGSPTRPSFTITTSTRYTTMKLADLNADGNLDLVGANSTDDVILSAILDAEGTASSEQSMPCSGNPRLIDVGYVDAGPTLDVVGLCTTTYELPILLGKGDGSFEAAAPVLTIASPKRLALGAMDGDEHADIVIVAAKELAIHYGLGAGQFTEPVFVLQDDTRSFTDLEVVDFNADGKLDIVASDNRLKAALFFAGKGTREFEMPVTIALTVPPTLLEVADVDFDGRLDVIAGSSTVQSAGIALALGDGSFAAPQVFRTGVAPAFVRVLDVNGDHVSDIVALSAASSAVVLGISDGPPPVPRFRRGDADLDGSLALNDAVFVLNNLFQGGRPLRCPDAADFNDDAGVNLTDPVGILRYLFQGGGPPAPPGPTDCGEDATADDLGPCAGSGC